MGDAKGPASGVCLMVFVAASFACTYAANHMCNFVQVYDSNSPEEYMSRGIWKGMWDIGDECSTYRDSGLEIDRRWNSARAMSVVADILVGLALIMSCASAVPQGRNMAAAGSNSSLLLLACLFQGVTLLFLTSSACTSGVDIANATCEISQAGNLSIAATVLLFASSLVACCVGATAMKEKSVEKDEEVGEEAPKE